MTTAANRTAEETAGLVRRAAAGDRRAWEQLVDDYVGLIWSIARGFGLNQADAGDVVQTTWLRLLEHIDRLNDPSRVGAWLATTARRECLRVVANGKRMTLAGDDRDVLEQPDTSLLPPDAALIATEEADQVNAALWQLPPRWRDLMLLLMADPAPSYEEISRELGVPIGSIGPTRGRALRRLQELLPSVASLDDEPSPLATTRATWGCVTGTGRGHQRCARVGA